MSFGILEDFLTVTRDIGVYDSSIIESAFDEKKLAQRSIKPYEFESGV